MKLLHTTEPTRVHQPPVEAAPVGAARSFPLEALPLAGLIASSDWTIQSVNAAWETLTGWSSSETIGMRLGELVQPLDADRLQRVSGQFENQGGETTQSLEIGVKRKRGGWIWMELAVRPEKSDSNLPQRFLCLFTDVSEYQLRNDQLRHAVEHERELRQALNGFIAMLSHEFRRPASNIAHATEVLGLNSTVPDADRLRRYLRLISENASLLDRLGEQLILSTHLNSGKWPFSPVETDLRALCLSVIQEFDLPQTGASRLRFEGPAEPLQIRIDPLLIRIAVSNLISNAFKYSGQDCPVVVRLTCVHGTLELAVGDTGIGIRPEDEFRLFQPFQRGSNVGTTKGNGLGLAIARECVELHGGTITWNRGIQTGAEFAIRLTRPKVT